MSGNRLGIDLTPLRVSTQYRRLYIAGFITALGSQATYVVVPYQLKNLTNSPLDVGALGLFELVPLVVFGLYGGVLADRMNRRRLILIMELVLMASTALLLANPLLAPLLRRSHRRRGLEPAESERVSHESNLCVAGSATIILGPRQREWDHGIHH